MPPVPPNRLVSTGPGKVSIWSRAITGLFPDEFLNAALSDPDTQCYGIGWIAEDEGVPKIELTFEAVPPGARTAENRKIVVSGGWQEPKPALMHRLQRARVRGLIDRVFVEQELLQTRRIGSFGFEIRPPASARRIRDALLAFAIMLENCGFRCHSPIVFDWRQGRDDAEFMKRQYDATLEILAMEETERNEFPDTTQARQALAEILKKLPD